jgi:hypothetical protein
MHCATRAVWWAIRLISERNVLPTGRDLFDQVLRLARQGRAPQSNAPLKRVRKPSLSDFAALRKAR